jgi:serine kinase of HPr protein (carbohydrate metabolism regulator)
MVGRSDPVMLRVHATCVEVGGAGVLLRGASGAGKSDLALRLIDDGAALVADDQVELRAAKGALVAAPPAVLAGMIEVRGLGLARLPSLPQTRVRLVVDLDGVGPIERLPKSASCDYLGVAVPLIRLAAFEASTAAKVRLAVRLATGDIILAND